MCLKNISSFRLKRVLLAKQPLRLLALPSIACGKEACNPSFANPEEN